MKVVLLALSHEERDYLLRLLRTALAKREDRRAVDLVEMLENALEPGAVGSLHT